MATVVSGSNSGNNYVDSLIYSGAHWSGTINYFFSNQYQTWTPAEMTAFTNALQAWANVANMQIQQVNSAVSATFVEYSLSNAQTTAILGSGGGGTTLGVHELPVIGASQPYYGWFNRDGYGFAQGVGYNASGLVIGGEGYATMLHEIGHGLGLTHPFDTSAGAGSYVLPSQFDQGAFTVMSYYDGWTGQNPFGNGQVSQGYNNTPGAIDIAAIQQLYGANTTFNSTATVYNLTTQTGLTTIWDTGGIDQILYTGSASATIDLRPATMVVGSAIAGGVVSYVSGGYGGFTIAADFTNVLANQGSDTGVIIENVTSGSGADTITLTAGNVNNLINGNGGSDTVIVSYNQGSGYTIQAGSTASNLVMLGSAGTDTLQNVEFVTFANGATVSTASLAPAPGPTFTESADVVTLTQPGGTWNALGGADQVTGTSGNDIIYGGLGADILRGSGGNDTLLGDGAVMPTENAAKIYRLYLATLGRGPDDAGQIGWTNALDSGTSLNSIASGFINSAEFQSRYGSLDNTLFTTLLYTNVLHRVPDAAGLAYWVNQLNTGMSRTDVVLGFSESPEFTKTSDPEFHAGQVYRLYGATLNRVPDAGGFDDWVRGLDTGMGINDVAGGFVGSQEFQALYGTLNNTQFVTLLYNNVLHRAPDAGGLADWVNALNNGVLTRTQVVVGFSDSAEYIGNTSAALHTFMATIQPTWNDTIEGGAGNDTVSGGHGNDTYVFRATEIGTDHVYLFESWDTLQFIGYNYATSAQAISHMTQSGNNVVFTDQGQNITFHGATIADMQQANWLLA